MPNPAPFRKRKTLSLNENPVPRKIEELPDIEKFILDWKDVFDDIVENVRRRWHASLPYWKILVLDIEDEIRATVMLQFALRWTKYRDGIIDEWPPDRGWMVTSAYYQMRNQFYPQDDAVAISDNDIPELVQDIIVNGRYTTCVARHSIFFQSPLNSVINKEEGQQPEWTGTDELFVLTRRNKMPDLLDIWSIGWSLREMCVIYGVNYATMKRWLNTYYDALQAAGGKARRKRPPRMKRYRNRHRDRIKKIAADLPNS